jgi:DDE superfamily endonuclease
MVTSFKSPPHGQLAPARRLFNRVLNRPRIIVEHTIGLLKNRFSWLYRIQPRLTDEDRSLVNVLRYIEVCIVLHNFCLSLTVEQELMEELVNDLNQNGIGENIMGENDNGDFHGNAGVRDGDDRRRLQILQAVIDDL